jgi:hypothetical protein
MSTTRHYAFNPSVSRPPRSARQPAPVSGLGAAAIETLILVILVILLVLGLVHSSAQASGHQQTAKVFVEKGDTPWSIAAEHPVEGQTTEQTAEQIADMNGTPHGVLSAGAAIEVPTSPGHSAAVACR